MQEHKYSISILQQNDKLFYPSKLIITFIPIYILSTTFKIS